MKRAEFLRAVGMLAGSAVLGHGLTAAVLPVLSRIYSPGDFSVLAVFASLASVLSVVAALRFDIAIPIPREDADALSLLALSVVLACAISSLLLVVALGWSPWIARQLGQSQLEPYLSLLPLAVLSACCYSALQSWFVRDRGFSILARSRIAQSAASAGTQVGLGYAAVAPLGLLVGYVVNTAMACLTLGGLLIHGRGREFRDAFSLSRMHGVFRDYSRFPKYSTLEAICNNGSVHLPIIMVAAIAAGPEAGYIALAMTLMQAPMSLVGSAIGQVYLSRAAEEHRAGRLPGLTTETISYLFKTGVGPLVAAGVIAPFVFEFVFGAGWERAGQLVAWMTPWFVLQFLAVPIAMSLHVTGHQRRALLLQVVGLLIRVGAVIIAANLARDMVAEAYALSGAVFYFIYLQSVLVVTKVDRAHMMQSLAVGMPHVMAWTIFAAASAVVLGLATGRP